MKKNLLFILIPFSLILISWGYQAHYHINARISYSFNEEMTQFLPWAPILEEHGADADKRKPYTPGESIKHYIDIDNYSGFINNGRIPHSFDSVLAVYGSSFVYDQGILPWATKTTFDSLTNCFARGDWAKAILFAADLGHYVADGHMPLHITANYNGELTGNYGIHSRFESTMINTYLYQITYQGDSISFIDSVQNFIFDYIYESYPFVDSIIDADNYASDVAGNNTSSTYTQILWQQTQHFTKPLFKKASNATASLIYTAWSIAGKPQINSIEEHYTMQKPAAFPNPSNGTFNLKFERTLNPNSTFCIYNQIGQLVYQNSIENLQVQNNTYTCIPGKLSPGIYKLLVIENKRSLSTVDICIE